MQSPGQKNLQILLNKNLVGKESYVCLCMHYNCSGEKIFYFLKIENVLKYFCKEAAISMWRKDTCFCYTFIACIFPSTTL